VALIRDNYELVIAHVGDSPAILARGKEMRRLTKDHCPSDEDERRRVEEAGGTVSLDELGGPRVNRRLAMTRSIGDFELKPYGVTAEPDVKRLNLKHHKDRFLLLATDGVSFVMNDNEIGSVIGCCDTPQEAAEKVTITKYLVLS